MGGSAHAAGGAAEQQGGAALEVTKPRPEGFLGWPARDAIPVLYVLADRWIRERQIVTGINYMIAGLGVTDEDKEPIQLDPEELDTALTGESDDDELEERATDPAERIAQVAAFFGSLQPMT